MILTKTIKEDNLDSRAVNYFPFKRVAFAFGALSLTQWLASDVIHVPFGGIGILCVGAGIWTFSSFSKGSFRKPSTLKGWLNRCNEVIDQFELLEEPQSFLENSIKRQKSLQQILSSEKNQSVAFISTSDIQLPERDFLEPAFEGIDSLDFYFDNSLSVHNQCRSFPESFLEKELLIYFLPIPFRAVDLLWLETIPDNQPSWIMTTWNDSSTWSEQQHTLESQLPIKFRNRILRLQNSNDQIKETFVSIRRFLNHSSKNLDSTKQRLLERFHSSMQGDLESLRREKFKNIQVRSQWIVAGAVFASPVPSTDVLSVAVVNGLMVQEMANLWSCKLKPDLLKAVAKQLAIAALAQGVVEWSGQALLGVAKLHGGTWLAAGSMQALSAAYLTRVVGRSMADWMAMNNGVTEPDLDLLKHQAPKLVSQAMESEKVDWGSFVNNSMKWINDNNVHYA